MIGEVGDTRMDESFNDLTQSYACDNAELNITHASQDAESDYTSESGAESDNSHELDRADSAYSEDEESKGQPYQNPVKIYTEATRQTKNVTPL